MFDDQIKDNRGRHEGEKPHEAGDDGCAKDDVVVENLPVLKFGFFPGFDTGGKTGWTRYLLTDLNGAQSADKTSASAANVFGLFRGVEKTGGLSGIHHRFGRYRFYLLE
jgi:hypothetical protein